MYQEVSFILCEKCFKGGNYEKDKLADDFKLKDSVDQAAIWTEAETLLLLESVLKHGDDWDLVAKNVQTKTKVECISKLIQLPFGDLMFGGHRKSRYLDVIADINNSKQVGLASNASKESVEAEGPSPELQNTDDKQASLAFNESKESVEAEGRSPELENKDQQNGDAENEGPPRKRVCTEPTSDIGSSLMKQVLLLVFLVHHLH